MVWNSELQTPVLRTAVPDSSVNSRFRVPMARAIPGFVHSRIHEVGVVSWMRRGGPKAPRYLDSTRMAAACLAGGLALP